MCVAVCVYMVNVLRNPKYVVVVWVMILMLMLLMKLLFETALLYSWTQGCCEDTKGFDRRYSISQIGLGDTTQSPILDGRLNVTGIVKLCGVWIHTLYSGEYTYYKGGGGSVFESFRFGRSIFIGLGSNWLVRLLMGASVICLDSKFGTRGSCRSFNFQFSSTGTTGRVQLYR